MKTSHHKIHDKHFATIEMRDNYIYIWISEWQKCFFGLLTTDTRISYVKLFTLLVMNPKDEGRPCTTETTTGVNGRIMRLENNRRNIDSFDIAKEIEILYNDFLEDKKQREIFEAKLLKIGKNI